MLHAGILESYNRLKGKWFNTMVVYWKKGRIIQQDFAQALLAEGEASQVLANPKLLEEVLGPFGLIISCADLNEMKNVMEQLEGQITITFAASAQDIRECQAPFQLHRTNAEGFCFRGCQQG
jgi:NADP-dependent aldehyde dehydrogenase